ncbi:hypothetical protein ES703_44422 [subsurface metagenome]
MKHYEHRVIEFEHSGAQAANTPWLPPAFEIEADEMGEVVFAEVDPPVTGGGLEEPLERWYPVLDGSKYDDYLALNGTWSPLMNPRQLNTLGNIVAFGTPVSEAVKKAIPMLEARCPKFKSRVSVEAWAGAGGITADYHIRLHLYVYRKEELPAIAAFIPGLASLRDVARGRTIPVGKGSIALTYDKWDGLPGGLDQSPPMINPFIRWATNYVATTPNSDYSFRVVLGNVDPTKEWQQLYFDYEAGEYVLMINGLGVRADAAGHLKDTALLIAGDYHPKGRLFTELDDNVIHFGHMYPFDDIGSRYFTPVPKFDRPYIIYDEIGEIVIRDDGVAVLAGDVVVALSGVLIERV